MFVNVAVLHVAPGREAEFEENNRKSNEAIRRAPGFVSRQMLRDDTNPGRYFYSSVWRSKADVEAYRLTSAVVAQKDAFNAANIMVGPHDQCDCTIIKEEFAAAPDEI